MMTNRITLTLVNIISGTNNKHTIVCCKDGHLEIFNPRWKHGTVYQGGQQHLWEIRIAEGRTGCEKILSPDYVAHQTNRRSALHGADKTLPHREQRRLFSSLFS